jgi:hypothetical protein
MLVRGQGAGMALSLAWRNFRRMQDLTLGFACLALLADAILAWPVVPGTLGLKVIFIVLFPAFYLTLVAACGLLIAPLRDFITRFVWITFRTGFGQSVISVLIPFAVLAAITAYTWWVAAHAASGGQYPAGVFSGFGAGIGLLIVQAVITHRIERDPILRQSLEE